MCAIFVMRAVSAELPASKLELVLELELPAESKLELVREPGS